MNNNPFETLATWLQKNGMTNLEKNRMRSALVHYATTHPVKSGLMSPYMFRYAAVALASLVLVLGGSAGISAAAASALPNDSLYSVKIWIEEYRAKNQKTPDDIIAFETKRIETRFDEATKLALRHQLDDATAMVVQSGIEHSRTTVKNAADSIQHDSPERALAASNELETAFSSNGKILAAIERTTNQSLGTIVLSAQVATEKIATEKAEYEKIIAMKPDQITKSSAQEKLVNLLAMIPEPVIADTKTDEPVIEPEIIDDVTPTETIDNSLLAKSVPMLTAMSVPVVEEVIIVEPTAQDLIAEAKIKMENGKYSEALVLLGKAEQLISEEQLTEKLEKTYKVDTDESATKASPETPATSPTIEEVKQ